MRAKLCRWSLPGVPREVETRAFKRFELISTWCQPKILSVYLRSLFNGWVTDRRMASLRSAQGLKSRGCVLGCGWDEDSIEHYGCCSLYWGWLSSARPFGMDIPSHFRSKAAFLLLRSDMRGEDAVRMAVGMYALYMTVNQCRNQDLPSNARVDKILHIWARRGAKGSKASRLLGYRAPTH